MTGIDLLLIAAFIIISVVFVYLIPIGQRWKILLGTSLVFYSVIVGYKVILMIFLAWVTYVFSRQANLSNHKIAFALILLLSPLILYKVTASEGHFEMDKFQSNLIDGQVGWMEWIQVIGLSYFTFNAISYLIDIKRKYVAAEQDFFLVLLYLLYFPAIFSGPLHRAKYMFGQLKAASINDESLVRGFRLILWGLFKNLVIAKRLNTILQHLPDTGLQGKYHLLIGLIFFLYLYCNFSSFIDFFQGVSQIFNIRLKNNFGNRIYWSKSRHHFWKGWHITLNEWFRDYFFFVLSKHDRSRKFTDLILLTTFILIALWHEVSMVLFVWGICNGLWILLEKKANLKEWQLRNVRNVMGPIYHLCFSSLLAMIFISPDLGYIFDKLFIETSVFPAQIWTIFGMKFTIVALCFMVMDFYSLKAGKLRFDDYLQTKSVSVRWWVYFSLTMLILIFGQGGGLNNYYIRF